MDLSSKKCVPCEVGTPPMSKSKANEYLKEVEGWSLEDEKILKIKNSFKFKDFKEAMNFVNQVASLAEEEGHHPDIYIFYNKVNLELFTHAANGLSENDFVMAAKINRLGNSITRS